jgi:hypothetical protein
MTGTPSDVDLIQDSQRLRDQLLALAAQLDVYVTDLRREVRSRQPGGRGTDDDQRRGVGGAG